MQTDLTSSIAGMVFGILAYRLIKDIFFNNKKYSNTEKLKNSDIDELPEIKVGTTVLLTSDHFLAQHPFVVKEVYEVRLTEDGSTKKLYSVQNQEYKSHTAQVELKDILAIKKD